MDERFFEDDPGRGGRRLDVGEGSHKGYLRSEDSKRVCRVKDELGTAGWRRKRQDVARSGVLVRLVRRARVVRGMGLGGKRGCWVLKSKGPGGYEMRAVGGGLWDWSAGAGGHGGENGVPACHWPGCATCRKCLVPLPDCQCQLC